MPDPLIIEVLYFQALRDATGREREVVEVAAGTTADSLIGQLIEAHPKLDRWRASILIAINEEWAEADALLQSGDCLALMPPVSGG
ncbi:MAG: MoaD/ThiS family protein [Sumerlaeia bacterium]